VRKVLVFIESFSIGDTVAAVPYVNKFQEVNPTDDISISVNDWLIPYFSTVYPDLKFIGKKTGYIFDKIIDLKYDYNKPIQQGYAEQLGFINTPYIRPNILIPNMERPIKNKYVTIGVHSTSQLKYWNHPLGIKSQPLSPYWEELCGLLRKNGLTPVIVEKDEMFVKIKKSKSKK
jgi:hypothetical protein